MKHLYFMRHAKSDWLNSDTDDRERTLHYIGINEAKIIAKEIINRNIKFDAIISSPAKRALQTAEIVKNKIGFDKEIIVKECFYFEEERVILKEIKNIDNNFQNVLLVGHNPTWSKMVMQLSIDNQRVYMDNANFASLSGDFNDWNEIEYGKLNFEYILSPKNL